MSTASFLNKIGKASTSTSGYMNFDSLEQGTPYKVSSFATFESKAFDKERTCVCVNLKDGYVILPERYDSCYKRLKTMNLDKLFIIYRGRKGKNKRLEIDFEEHDVDDEEEEDNKNKNKKKNNNNNNKNKKQRLE